MLATRSVPRRWARLAILLAAAACWPAVLAAAEQSGGSKSDAVVKITAKVTPENPGADRKQEVTVTLTMEKGWHIYANPVGLEDLKTSQTVVKITGKRQLESTDVSYPDGTEIDDPVLGKYRVLDGKTTVTAKIKRAAGDSGPLEVTVKFQACNDRQCLIPASKTITVP